MRSALVILALVACNKETDDTLPVEVVETDTPEPPTYCETLELTDRPFQDAEPMVGRGNMAADFTVKTLDG